MWIVVVVRKATDESGGYPVYDETFERHDSHIDMWKAGLVWVAKRKQETGLEHIALEMSGHLPFDFDERITRGGVGMPWNCRDVYVRRRDVGEEHLPVYVPYLYNVVRKKTT